MENLIVYGAGDLGCEYVWFIKAINEKEPRWNLIGFIDDYLPKGKTVFDYKVLGGKEYLFGVSEKVNVICAITNPTTRKKIISDLKEGPLVKFPILIHPSAIISNQVKIGGGTVIGPGCVISIHVEVGKHVIVSQNSSLSSHVNIGDYVTIAPACNLGDHVKIGEGAFIGIGNSIMSKSTISSNTVLGADVALTEDMSPFNKP